MFCDLFYGDLAKGQNNYSSLFHSKCCPFPCTTEVLPSIEASQLLRSSLFLDVTQRSEELIFTQQPEITLLVLFFQEDFGFWHSTLYSFWKLQKSVFLVTVDDWFQEDIWMHPSLHISVLDIQTSNEIQVLRLLHRCSWAFCSFW